MASSSDLRAVFAAARPLIEEWLDIAEQIAALRDMATDRGLDWSQVKSLVKAQVQDERAGETKRVQRIIEKAEFASAYAGMLGLANMNEENFSAGETGMVLGTGRERPLSIAYPDGDPEARFEPASLHQEFPPHDAETGGLAGDVRGETRDAGESATAAQLEGDEKPGGGGIPPAHSEIQESDQSGQTDVPTPAESVADEISAPIRERPVIPEFLRRGSEEHRRMVEEYEARK